MHEPFVIAVDGVDYTWSPCKSTPSASAAIAELPQIATLLQERGAKTVVDFGAGRGRNANTLSHSFDKLLLVDEDLNLPYLRQVAAHSRAQTVTVQSWQEYRRSTTPKVDAVFICFVIHTLPTPGMRSQIIATNVGRLRRNGAIVFVTPRNDPKYRPGLISDAVRFNDGIVRLYRAKMAFSFYRNYTRNEFVNVIEDVGLTVEAMVPSARRMIFLATRRRE